MEAPQIEVPPDYHLFVWNSFSRRYGTNNDNKMIKMYIIFSSNDRSAFLQLFYLPAQTTSLLI